MKSEARSHVEKKKQKGLIYSMYTQVQHTECMLEGNMKPKNKHFLT